MSAAEARSLAVAIDTASDLPGVALSENGVLLAEASWRTRQGHSRELLPTLEWLLARVTRNKAEIGALFVCTGPGSYAGLRVGVSTAKALAYGLDAALVGVGRLAADAEPLVASAPGRVVAVHAAGRAELAWAAYGRGEGEMRELMAPQLGPVPALIESLGDDDIVCCELRTLDAATLGTLQGIVRAVEAPSPRIAAVSRIGQTRWSRGVVDNADTLVPLYLRAPAIGPQS
ncbi:MAG TPA: tRNA (adenosine(37)-N6)-threonylcarbamoyltransferase complex dimerization subunit type 1 TsaB [Dehalococcoidia bacterium]|nr:tRNA (adenosine(37)-N6)-threonylcarbamoyltransferase complex dimerization subunit type 1 TsaB [Dehalococcoidia bacterium]